MVQKKTDVTLEIVLQLLKSQMHIRALARALGKPHVTILRKIADLEQENIINIEIQGKNKIVSLKKTRESLTLIESAELYKRAQLFNKYPKLAIIAGEIKKQAPKSMVILFGSYAKGKENKNSDIDVYLETTDTKIKAKVHEIDSRLNVKIGPFDQSSPLIKEIIKNHIILQGVEQFYEHPTIFA